MSRPDCDVVVVGGGLAGLVAARELGGGGRSVVLLEARDRLGGRTWTKPGAMAGLDLEMGAMSVDRMQVRICAELERYGIPREPDAVFSPPTIWTLRGERRTGMLPVPPSELASLERLLAACHEAAALAADGRLPASLDVSIVEWADGLGLEPWTRELAVEFGCSLVSGDPAQTSMLLLARQMACAGGLWPLLSADYAGIPDGTRALVAALAQDGDPDTRLGAAVAAVHAAGADAVEVHLAGDGGTLRARAAVLTPPLNALRAIDLGDAPSPAARRGVQAGTPNVGAKYWALVRDAPDDFHALGPAGGIDVASTWRRVDAGVVIVAFGRAAAALDGDDPAAVQAALRHYLPDVEVLESTWHDWSSDAWAGGTWGGWRPGWATGGMRELLEPAGRIVIAGSETAERWPGFMEGAIDSGVRAARTVAGLLLAEAA